MNMQNKPVVVVGGGVAGLTMAYELAKRGAKVHLVEKASQIGGLSRSFSEHNCILDIGVHLLHLRDAEVEKKVYEVLLDSSQLIKITRNGKLYIQKHYVDWPLTKRSLVQMPFLLSCQIAFDQLFRKKKITGDMELNYENAILELYGPTIYEALFKPLTSRFLSSDPTRIDADWAYSSIRSATKIEDKSFNESYKYLPEKTDEKAKKDFNLFKFLLSQLSLKAVEDPFYYFRDGYGVLVESYAARIRELGGEIHLNTTVSSLRMDGDKIEGCTFASRDLDISELVWAANPSALCSLLNMEEPKLPYLHSKFVYVFLSKETMDHQVCYYADADVSFVRATIMSNHSKSIIRNPSVKAVLCLEYTAKEPSELKTKHASIIDSAKRDCVTTGLVQSVNDIVHLHYIDVPFSYPILELGYKSKLNALNNKLSKYNNLHTIGRQAGFSYENADVLIKESIHHKLLRKFQDK